mmetsp:Transcript_78816/g.213396  ORF Transcript_78816/g.213396 Transcript_78816/m.213396 type:complete len:218 (+) Transcript_78816:369-1022(+)
MKWAPEVTNPGGVGPPGVGGAIFVNAGGGDEGGCMAGIADLASAPGGCITRLGTGPGTWGPTISTLPPGPTIGFGMVAAAAFCFAWYCLRSPSIFSIPALPASTARSFSCSTSCFREPVASSCLSSTASISFWRSSHCSGVAHLTLSSTFMISVLAKPSRSRFLLSSSLMRRLLSSSSYLLGGSILSRLSSSCFLIIACCCCAASMAACCCCHCTYW